MLWAKSNRMLHPSFLSQKFVNQKCVVMLMAQLFSQHSGRFNHLTFDHLLQLKTKFVGKYIT